MSQVKHRRSELERAQARLLRARGFDQGTLRLVAAMRSGSSGDLCAQFVEQRLITPGEADGIRVKAAAALRVVKDSERHPRPEEQAPTRSEAAALTVPGYEILGKLGQGAMGLVARARHLESGRLVALKSILAEDGESPKDEDLRRFQREARTLTLLKHRCVVEVLDVVLAPASLHLAMELIEGQDLRAFVKGSIRKAGGPPRWEQLEWVFRDLAEALDYIGGQGVIHRDLKPQNVVLDRECARAVLIDFGLLKRIRATRGAPNATSLTDEGSVVGTPAFASPEQLCPDGEYGPLTIASDVWGFGATLFYALSGRPPYLSDSLLDLLLHMKAAAPPDLRALNPDAPAWVAELCKSCLQRSAGRRPTMAGVKQILAQAGAPPRRRRLTLALRAAAVLLVAAVLAAAAWIGVRQPPASAAGTREGPAPLLLDGVRLAIQAERGPVCLVGSAVGDGPIFVTAKVKCEDRASFDFEYRGRRYQVRGEEGVRLPLVRVDERRALAPVALVDGVWRCEERILWSEAELAAARRALSDHETWAKTAPGFLKEIGRYLAFKLGEGFADLGLRVFDCEGRSQAILRVRHERSGIVFHLIPGGEVKLTCYSDPEASFVRGLEAVRRMPGVRRRFSDYQTEDIAARAQAYFDDRFRAVFTHLKAREGMSGEDLELIRAYFQKAEGWRELSEERLLPLLDRFYAALGRDLEARHTAVDTRRVAPFLIAACETTAEEWSRLTGAAAEGGSQPITGLPRAAWLRAAQASDLRLPRREEWLHALAGGRVDAYFWGWDPELLDEYAWYARNARRRPDNSGEGRRRGGRDGPPREPRVRPATQHEEARNAFGLVDMLGNAGEWCVEDWPAYVRCLQKSGIQEINVDASGRRLRFVVGDGQTAGQRDGARLAPVLGGDAGFGSMSILCTLGTFREERLGEDRPSELKFTGCRLAFDLPELGF